MVSGLTLSKLPLELLSQWDSMVANSPFGTVYHHSSWLLPAAKAAGEELAVHIARHAGEFAGGIALQVRKKGPITIAKRIFATPYAYPIIASNQRDNAAEITSEIIRQLRNHYSQTTITAAPWWKPVDGITGSRLSKLTYLLDLDSEHRLWSAFQSELRNRIRKAQSNGVVIDESDDFRAFYNMFNHTLARRGLSTSLSVTSFVSLIESQVKEGSGKVYFARLRNGDPGAAALILWDRHRSYYSFGGSSPEGRKDSAAPLLFWRIIQNLVGQKSELDLGGANIASVRRFKNRFRARSAQYEEISYYRNSIEWALLKAYEKLRHGQLTGNV